MLVPFGSVLGKGAMEIGALLLDGACVFGKVGICDGKLVGEAVFGRDGIGDGGESEKTVVGDGGGNEKVDDGVGGGSEKFDADVGGGSEKLDVGVGDSCARSGNGTTSLHLGLA